MKCPYCGENPQGKLNNRNELRCEYCWFKLPSDFKPEVKQPDKQPVIAQVESEPEKPVVKKRRTVKRKLK